MGFRRIGFAFSRGSRPQMVGKHPPADSPWALPRGRDASPNTGQAQSCLESGFLLPVRTTRLDDKGTAGRETPPHPAETQSLPWDSLPVWLRVAGLCPEGPSPSHRPDSCWGHAGLVRFFLMFVYNHVLEEPTSRKRPGAQKAGMPRWPRAQGGKWQPPLGAAQGSSPHLRVTPREATEVTSHNCGKPTPLFSS